MHGFDVLVSNIGPPLPSLITYDYKLCKHRSAIIPLGKTETLHCSTPVQGRYVYVSINSTSATAILTICELKVFSHGMFHSFHKIV